MGATFRGGLHLKRQIANIRNFDFGATKRTLKNILRTWDYVSKLRQEMNTR